MRAFAIAIGFAALFLGAFIGIFKFISIFILGEETTESLWEPYGIPIIYAVGLGILIAILLLALKIVSVKLKRARVAVQR